MQVRLLHWKSRRAYLSDAFGAGREGAKSTRRRVDFRSFVHRNTPASGAPPVASIRMSPRRRPGEQHSAATLKEKVPWRAHWLKGSRR